MKKTLAMLCLLVVSVANGQEPNKNWRQDLSGHLQQYLACENTAANGINPCNMFLGSALTRVYKVNDFYSKELGRHMLVSEMAQYLQESKQWTLLGRGYEQKALRQAQDYANSGKAAVAIYLNEEGVGHMAVILPGEMKPSGTWGFHVPNSASFFTTAPEKSYIDKGLSYAYERPLLKGVLLYGRN